MKYTPPISGPCAEGVLEVSCRATASIFRKTKVDIETSLFIQSSKANVAALDKTQFINISFQAKLSYQKSTAGWFQFQNLPESFPKHKHTRKKPGRHYHAIHTTLQLSTFSYNDVCLSQQRNCAAEQSCLVCQFQNLHPIPTNNLVVGRGWEQNS